MSALNIIINPVVKLFTTSPKELSDSWFSVTHKAIQSAKNTDELKGLQTAIDSELQSMWVNTSTKERLIWLLAYANLRIRLSGKKRTYNY